MPRTLHGAVLIAFVVATLAVTASGASGANAAPANDAFGNATALAPSGSITASNVGASLQTAEPQPSCCTADATIWFKWAAPATGRVTFDTGGSDVDTVLAVYTGARLSGLTEVVSDDDGFGCDTASLVQFDATAGTTYRIQVASWLPDDTSANLHLTWNWFKAPRPANDDVAGAPSIPATASPSVTTGDTSGATAEPASFAGEQLGDSSVWYAIAAPGAGVVDLDLAVSTAANAWGQPPLVEVGIWTGATPALVATVVDGVHATVPVTAAGTIWLQVHSFLYCAGGAFTLTTSFSDGTAVTSLYTQPELDAVTNLAARFDVPIDQMQVTSVAAWMFIYGLAGRTPQPIAPPGPGTIPVVSVWKSSDIGVLDALATGWANTPGDTQRIASDAWAFIVGLGG